MMQSKIMYNSTSVTLVANEEKSGKVIIWGGGLGGGKFISAPCCPTLLISCNDYNIQTKKKLEINMTYQTKMYSQIDMKSVEGL